MKQLFNNIASMPGVTAEMAMELFTILLRDWAVRVLDAADPHWGHGRVSGWPAVVISTDREAPAKTRWFRQKSGPLSYDAARLADQLDEQGRAFFADATKNRVDREAGVLYLSPIFKWFEEDFTRDGKSLGEFAAPYFPRPEDRQAALSGKLKVRFTRYDWTLNNQ